jgi:hypothetical protein
MAAPRDEVAVSMFESVAKEPESRPAPVRVRVAALQTSVARLPIEVRVRVEYDQTRDGSEVMSEPIEVEALETAVLVLALTTAAKLEVAVVKRLAVLLSMTAASEVVAVVMVFVVLVLIAV